MKNCAATVRVLLLGSRTLPSLSAEDCTAHRDSLLSKSGVSWRASEDLVVTKEMKDNGSGSEDSSTD
jgi:hypothetical protein